MLQQGRGARCEAAAVGTRAAWAVRCDASARNAWAVRPSPPGKSLPRLLRGAVSCSSSARAPLRLRCSRMSHIHAGHHAGELSVLAPRPALRGPAAPPRSVGGALVAAPLPGAARSGHGAAGEPLRGPGASSIEEGSWTAVCLLRFAAGGACYAVLAYGTSRRPSCAALPALRRARCSLPPCGASRC
jgi:hypothetical protein